MQSIFEGSNNFWHFWLAASIQIPTRKNTEDMICRDLSAQEELIIETFLEQIASVVLEKSDFETRLRSLLMPNFFGSSTIWCKDQTKNLCYQATFY